MTTWCSRNAWSVTSDRWMVIFKVIFQLGSKHLHPAESLCSPPGVTVTRLFRGNARAADCFAQAFALFHGSLAAVACWLKTWESQKYIREPEGWALLWSEYSFPQLWIDLLGSLSQWNRRSRTLTDSGQVQPCLNAILQYNLSSTESRWGCVFVGEFMFLGLDGSGDSRLSSQLHVTHQQQSSSEFLTLAVTC